ncbi:sigma factor, partial [Streptomyces sp. NPDC059695]|uniref:sigma factor n=1 Tax=Streptomyces sp. NPDC059695 TaxID=3346910 RepID=UPI0036865322
MARRFDADRGHLRSVAYRMLGSLGEAEDAVQEAWFKLSRSDVSGVENLSGWLTTVVGRVCLDMLRSRGSRREDPLEYYVPDPVVGGGGPPPPPPAAGGHAQRGAGRRRGARAHGAPGRGRRGA